MSESVTHGAVHLLEFTGVVDSSSVCLALLTNFASTLHLLVECNVENTRVL